MRLWSLHPRYLDSKGLVALWREALLAQSVLRGNTTGYRKHPQLVRFREAPDPMSAIAVYLQGVLDEADSRNYCFDRTKIHSQVSSSRITVTSGQVDYEARHLKAKLAKRDMNRMSYLNSVELIQLHPLFLQIPGDVESWEIVRTADKGR